VTAGSTRAARSAGIVQAMAAVIARMIVTAANGPELLEPLCQSHLAISFSAQVDAGITEVADAGEDEFARRGRIHPALDKLARAHLDVQGELLVDLLI
jgi:hypothetical protein